MFRIFLFFCLTANLSTFAQNCPDSCTYFIPNSLTPNCDGVDCELLTITSSCTFSKFHFSIYTRWGNVIFESDDPKKKFSSAGQNKGVCYWKLSGKFCNGKEINDTGFIHIL